MNAKVKAHAAAAKQTINDNQDRILRGAKVTGTAVGIGSAIIVGGGILAGLLEVVKTATVEVLTS